MDREECEDGEGGGIPVTPVYEDMHANDIRKKIKEYATTTKVPKATRSL